jgi:methylglyoxal synthase
MEKIKRIAMIAHDNRKKDLIEWVEWNWENLQDHKIICTGTTGCLVEEALLRISVLYNIPTACNRSTADFMISSELFNQPYQPLLKDYKEYTNRSLGD